MLRDIPCLYSGECIVDLERGAVSEKWGFQWDREACRNAAVIRTFRRLLNVERSRELFV